MEFACYSEWSELPDSANALFSEAEKESIFFSRPWLQNPVSRSLEEGHTLLLACVVEDKQVLALLPLMKQEGGHLNSLRHLYTSLFTLLLAEDAQQEVLDCLVLGLSRLRVASIKLDPIAEKDGKLLSLQQTLGSAGFTCHRHFRFYNWIHRTRGQSFADYMAERPARVRSTVTRKKRKLEREQGYSIRLFTNDDWPQGLADYNAVYKASWKAHELFDEFITQLADTLSVHGWLRLAVLYIAGQPAAAQFWFVVCGKASIFKLHYDQDWKQYSPGSILTSYLMEHVIDIDKVEEIDFLNGNDAYKQDWMSERRVRWTLYCARPRQTKGPLERITDSVKVWAKQLIRFSGNSSRPQRVQASCLSATSIKFGRFRYDNQTRTKTPF